MGWSFDCNNRSVTETNSLLLRSIEAYVVRIRSLSPTINRRSYIEVPMKPKKLHSIHLNSDRLTANVLYFQTKNALCCACTIYLDLWPEVKMKKIVQLINYYKRTKFQLIRFNSDRLRANLFQSRIAQKMHLFDLWPMTSKSWETKLKYSLRTIHPYTKFHSDSWIA